jgi:hypothetical protein
MHTDERPDPLVELGYEQKDIDAKRVFNVTMWFFGFAFFSWGIIYLGWWMLGYTKVDPAGNNLRTRHILTSPNPTLQTNITAKTDIRDMRKKERDDLDTSGSSKYTAGAIHIPIEQAIKLTADRKGVTQPHVEGIIR